MSLANEWTKIKDANCGTTAGPSADDDWDLAGQWRNSFIAWALVLLNIVPI